LSSAGYLSLNGRRAGTQGTEQGQYEILHTALSVESGISKVQRSDLVFDAFQCVSLF